MKLMPVGVGGTRNLSPTKRSGSSVKTLSTAADGKTSLNKQGGAIKRPFNYSLKPQANRANMMTLNSRLLLRPHELKMHPNSNLPPNAAQQAANQIRKEFKISMNKKIPGSSSLPKQPIEVKCVIIRRETFNSK